MLKLPGDVASAGGRRPLVLASTPSPLCEIQISKASAGPAQLRLAGVEMLGQAPIAADAPGVDSNEQARRKRLRLEAAECWRQALSARERRRGNGSQSVRDATFVVRGAQPVCPDARSTSEADGIVGFAVSDRLDGLPCDCRESIRA